MRECEEGDFCSRRLNRFHVWLDETNVGARMGFEAWEYLGDFFTDIGAGGDGYDFRFWVTKDEAEQLQTGVSACSNNRDFSDSRHLEGVVR